MKESVKQDKDSDQRCSVVSPQRFFLILKQKLADMFLLVVIEALEVLILTGFDGHFSRVGFWVEFCTQSLNVTLSDRVLPPDQALGKSLL